MAIDNLPNNDESRLSGAYIRSLVKQLTSTKPLHTSNDIKNNVQVSDGVKEGEFVHKGSKLAMAKQNSQHGGQQIGHKKQVRRRLHTSRPYQERLVNMAEARKEIVTALKFHRATMKQANERKQSPPQPIPNLHPSYPFNKSVRGMQDCKIHIPKNESHFYQYYLSCDSNSTSSNNNSNNYLSYPTVGSYPWLNSSTSLIEPTTIYDNLNIPLPNQPLGLNLNLQAFTNLDTNFDTPSKMKHSSSSSSISFPSSSSSTPRDLAFVEGGAGPTRMNGNNNVMMDHMHQALDEEEMAKIRSIGEQHQIEWDDTLNLVKSAWWLKFLKSMEFGKEMKGIEEMNIDKNNYEDHPFGEFMEFPSWLSTNGSFRQQHLDDSCSEDYGQDATLPWMDIGDIDGMDDEWLS